MATDCNNCGYYPKVTGKKRKIAEEIISPEFDGNISALCNKYNINRSTYYRWLGNDVDFRAYCEWLVEQYTESEIPNAWRQLFKKVDAGNLDAISLFFKLKGKFVDKVDVSGNVNVPVTIVDDYTCD